MPPSNRPQTLKQARRAYQKTGPSRPTASDIAQAERRQALQERADRIKAREARRKANVKKRDEKIATAKATGEDQKPRWRVGASQLSLGGFFNGIKRAEPSDHTKLSLCDVLEEADIIASQEKADDQYQILANPPVEVSAHDSVKDTASAPLAKLAPTCSAHQMPPPPLPLPSKQFEIPTEIETFDDCFPSNTQIQRELSPQPCKVVAVSQAISYSSKKHGLDDKTDDNAAKDTVDANELLACLSTQDLVLSSTPSPQIQPHVDLDLLAQISTQDLDFGDSSPKSAARAPLADPELLFGEISTQDLIFSQEPADIRLDIKSATNSFTDDELESFVAECGMDGFESALIEPQAIC